jgi:hypothetical protein
MGSQDSGDWTPVRKLIVILLLSTSAWLALITFLLALYRIF